MQENKAVEQTMKPTLRAIQVKYFQTQNSLSKSLGLAMKAISTELKTTVDSLNNTLESIELTSKDKNEDVLGGHKVSFEQYDGLMKRSCAAYELSIAAHCVPSSFLVSLVSQYDAYLGNLLHMIFKKKPEILNGSQKSINYLTLIEFDSIEDAQCHFIEKEIESLLRSSHTDQLQSLSTMFGVALKPEQSLYNDFVEITERRNLFVHCDGKVSRQYLQKCKHIDTKEVQVGTRLDVRSKYFKDAYHSLLIMGVLVGQVLCRKLFPNDLEEADSALMEISFELLKAGNYNTCSELCRFGFNGRTKLSSDEFRRILIINDAIAQKRLGNNNYLKSVHKEDWSACDSRFRLAVSVLEEDWKNAFTLMLRVGKDERVGKMSYLGWPLFAEFRKTKEFKQAFKAVFNEDYAVYEEDMACSCDEVEFVEACELIEENSSACIDAQAC